MRVASLIPLLGVTAVALAGCSKDGKLPGEDSDTAIGHDSADTDTDTDTDADTDTDTDTDVHEPGVHGDVQGMVYLQLYTTDENDDVVLMDWEDEFDAYPYGAVFVGAYQLDDEGYQVHYGSDTITSPTVMPAPGGDPYAIAIDADEIDSVYLYASVDLGADGFIGTEEPTAAHASEVYAEDGETVTGVDITVMIPYWDPESGGGGGGTSSTGGGGGDGCTAIDITGTATVSTSYLEGDVAVMLYGTDNTGPYYAERYTPTVTNTGATTDYDLNICENEGAMMLLGAWDSNVNGLIDPADRWGSYVNADDEDGNPITLGNTDQSDLDVLIPFGDHHPTVVPFVSLSGTITSTEDWSTWGAVYVAALKYRPVDETSVTDLETGYDLVSWDNADLVASTSLAYHVEVPADTITYLWVYGDPDGDGMVNEVGEPVASTADDGRIVTGETAQTGLDYELTIVSLR